MVAMQEIWCMDNSKVMGVANDLSSILDKEQILFNVPMKEHTSMQAGGSAKVIVLPSNIEQIKKVLKCIYEKNVPCYVMGNGTNLIVSDNGYDGIIIMLSRNFSQTQISENIITAQSGASIVSISNLGYRHSLSGLEFAAGIPGTVGGAVAMNAGAYDGEMKDVVTEATCVNKAGKVFQMGLDDLQFGYRTSKIQRDNLFVLEVNMKLKPGDKNQIKEKMRRLNDRRKDKQPLSLPSSGSIFKRPEGCYAGKLIEDADLKGYRVGGAQVSEKHCGFIVNTGGATASDVIELIEYIKQKVFDNSGVMLQQEVKILGG